MLQDFQPFIACLIIVLIAGLPIGPFSGGYVHIGAKFRGKKTGKASVIEMGVGAKQIADPGGIVLLQHALPNLPGCRIVDTGIDDLAGLLAMQQPAIDVVEGSVQGFEG